MARSVLYWSWAALASLAAQSAFAQADLQAEGYGPIALSYAHGGTDNIERIVNGNRGYYDALGVHLNFESMGQRIDAAVRGTIQYRTYSREEIKDETLGDLHAGGTLAIVPERFRWSLEGSYGQGATDPFALEGPSNRESIRVVQTGPELTLPFSDRMGLLLKGQFSDRSYSLSDQLDNESVRSEVTLFRQASRTARFNVSFVNSDIEYQSLLPGYEIESLAVGYTKQLASGNVVAQAGRNRVVFEESETSGPLYRIEWRRNLTAKTRLGLIASQQLTDAGELFGLVTGQIAADRPLGILLTSNPLQQSQVGVEYGYFGDRTSISLRLANTREEYEVNSSIDNDNVNTTIDFRRALTMSWSLGASASTLEREFKEVVQTTDDLYWSVYLNRKFARRFILDLSVGKNERSGENEPEERLYAIRFVYTPRETR
jgi:hypothetical protein